MSELEERLRTMLRERAGDVTHVPAHVLALPSARPPGARRTTWLVAAAVAIVLAVAAAVVAVSGNRHRSAPAVTKPPTVHPSTTAHPSPTTVAKEACTAALPSRWRTAVQSGTGRFGAESVMPLGISEDGRQVIATRDFGAARDVVVIDAAGHAHRIYSVPQPNTYQVIHASLDGNYAALDLSRYPRSAVTIIPSAEKVLLVDLRDLTVKVLATAPFVITGSGEQGRTIDGSVLWRGTVYWDVRPHYTARVTDVHAYSIATGHASVIAHSGPFFPRIVGGGVTWASYGDDTVSVWRTLPPPVPRAPGLQSDGTSYAWPVGRNRFAWWGPGRSDPVVLEVPGANEVHLNWVAGPFLFLDDDGVPVQATRVLDARTGALALVRHDMPLMAAGSTVVGYDFTGAFKVSGTALVRLDTAKLPGLHC